MCCPLARNALGAPERVLQSEREAEGVRYELWVRYKIRTTPSLRLAKSRLRRLLACIAPAGA